jgi:hypothetical protein
MRFGSAILLVFGLALTLQAQDERGWSFSGNLSGSGNTSGVVSKLDPAVGYKFNSHFSTYVGLPFYFVNSRSASASSGTMSGVGNATLGFTAGVDRPTLNYSSTVEFTAPTGDKDRGFSTGRVTVDWSNHVSHAFSSFTPYGSAGFANTVSDTAFFVRPFTSLGVVGHFEGGATYDVKSVVSFGASGYAVRGSGEQTIYSRVLQAQVTTPLGSTTPPPTTPPILGTPGSSASVGLSAANKRPFQTNPLTKTTAAAVNDHGYSAWFGVTPASVINFSAGFSRSENYDYNSFFFGIGFSIGK